LLWIKSIWKLENFRKEKEKTVKKNKKKAEKVADGAKVQGCTA
jgi:hypothetical protein